MKRILSYWAIFCCAACGLAACVQDDDPADAAGGDSIRLGVSGIERMTRAESTAVESRVDRLDVLIFDAAGVKRRLRERGTARQGRRKAQRWAAGRAARQIFADNL